MYKLVVASVAAATLMLAVASDAQASCFRRGGCGGCYSAPSDCGGCGYGMVGYGGCGPCVTYQQVWKEREIEVTVMRQVPRQVTFEFTVCVPVTRQETRKVMSCQTVTREVEFTYTVCVPETRTEKRKIVRMNCVPTVVEREVPCYSTVMVPCCNPCGGMSYTCQTVCTMQRVQCTVMQQVPQEVEIEVPITTFSTLERKGKRMVCELVPVEREVVVNICTMVPEKRTGTRTVCECVPSVEKRVVRYCEMVPVTVAPAPMPAPAVVPAPAMPVSATVPISQGESRRGTRTDAIAE